MNLKKKYFNNNLFQSNDYSINSYISPNIHIIHPKYSNNNFNQISMPNHSLNFNQNIILPSEQSTLLTSEDYQNKKANIIEEKRRRNNCNCLCHHIEEHINNHCRIVCCHTPMISSHNNCQNKHRHIYRSVNNSLSRNNRFKNNKNFELVYKYEKLKKEYNITNSSHFYNKKERIKNYNYTTDLKDNYFYSRNMWKAHNYLNRSCDDAKINYNYNAYNYILRKTRSILGYPSFNSDFCYNHRPTPISYITDDYYKSSPISQTMDYTREIRGKRNINPKSKSIDYTPYYNNFTFKEKHNNQEFKENDNYNYNPNHLNRNKSIDINKSNNINNYSKNNINDGSEYKGENLNNNKNNNSMNDYFNSKSNPKFNNSLKINDFINNNNKKENDSNFHDINYNNNILEYNNTNNITFQKNQENDNNSNPINPIDNIKDTKKINENNFEPIKNNIINNKNKEQNNNKININKNNKNKNLKDIIIEKNLFVKVKKKDKNIKTNENNLNDNKDPNAKLIKDILNDKSNKEKNNAKIKKNNSRYLDYQHNNVDSIIEKILEKNHGSKKENKYKRNFNNKKIDLLKKGKLNYTNIYKDKKDGKFGITKYTKFLEFKNNKENIKQNRPNNDIKKDNQIKSKKTTSKTPIKTKKDIPNISNKIKNDKDKNINNKIPNNKIKNNNIAKILIKDKPEKNNNNRSLSTNNKDKSIKNKVKNKSNSIVKQDDKNNMKNKNYPYLDIIHLNKINKLIHNSRYQNSILYNKIIQPYNNSKTLKNNNIPCKKQNIKLQNPYINETDELNIIYENETCKDKNKLINLTEPNKDKVLKMSKSCFIDNNRYNLGNSNQLTRNLSANFGSSCFACYFGCSVSRSGYSPMNFSPYDGRKRPESLGIPSYVLYQFGKNCN